MLLPGFNPLNPTILPNRELRFLFAEHSLVDRWCEKSEDMTVTHDYYVPCTHLQLPIMMRKTNPIVPSFLRRRITTGGGTMSEEIIFSHSPTYKERMPHAQFRVKYPTLASKMDEYSVMNTLNISKVKVGYLRFPGLERGICLEVIELRSSQEFAGKQFVSGEFEYETEDELDALFAAIRKNEKLVEMCNEDKIRCTYNPLLDIMYSETYFIVRTKMAQVVTDGCYLW